MELNPLSVEAFEATASEPMKDVTNNPHAAIPVDLWPYADQALAADFPAEATDDWDVCQVFQNREGTYQHVVIGLPKRSDRLVIVLALEEQCIHGHVSMDLADEMQREF